MATAPAGIVLRHIRDLVAADSLGRLPDGDLLQRFRAGREEAAFSALVQRHGPLVLGVCRRVLGNLHDAEDAFQATFLALAQKANSITGAATLAGWLYQVAYRTALRTKDGTAARQRREQHAEPRQPGDPLDELTARELLAVVDEEIHQLGEAHRTALLLCYFQGHTCDEAARLLGCSSRTLKRRLDQARKALRGRLGRRGLALPAALLFAGLTRGTAAAVSPLLAADTVRAALLVVAATPAAAVAPGLLHALFATRLRTVAALALLTGALALTAGASGLTSASRPPDEVAPPEYPGRVQFVALPDPPTPVPPPPNPGPKGRTTVAGRVLGAKGEALANIDVAVLGRAKRPGRGGDLLTEEIEVLAQGRTDGAGHFHLTGPRLSTKTFWQVHVVARAPGHGVGLQRLNPDLERPEATVRLLPELPVRGRLVDLAGQPAVGVAVRVWWVGEAANGQSEGVTFYAGPAPRDLKVWPAAAVTDAQGRFTLHGLAASPQVSIRVQDDRYAPTNLSFGAPVAGKELAQSLAPARLIEGRVLCADTGKPLPGALLTVFSGDSEFGSSGGLGGKADAAGRYRLNPNPGKWCTVTAHAQDGEPYLALEKRFQMPAAAVKHRLDLKLPRGVLVRGKVTESTSGKPVERAAVQFFPRRANNPFYRHGIVTAWQAMVETDADGAFQLPVLPGPGHLLVSSPTGDYVHEEILSGVLYNGTPGGVRYYPDAIVKLDLPAKLEKKEVAVKLRRGVSVRGSVTGPNGEAVDQALVICRLHLSPLDLSWRFPGEARDGRFQVNGLDPEKSYPVYFLEPRKQWGATVLLSGRQAGAAVKVRLEPCGKATARFVDGAGKPLAGHRPMIEIVVTPGAVRYDPDTSRKELVAADGDFLANVDRHNYWNGPQTDAAGRITFPALIPGVTYRVLAVTKDANRLGREFTAVAGKTADLGDIIHTR